MDSILVAFPTNADSPGKSILFGGILSVILGLICSWLNILLYQMHEPFFDSMAYHEKMFRTMVQAKELGWWAALSETFTGDHTSFMPVMIAALLGQIMNPSRLIGVWIQVAEVAIYLWTLDAYCRRVWRFDLNQRCLVLASFSSLACVFFTNGGLSDFRMDFSLALLYGAAGLRCLIARHSTHLIDFVWLGIVIGLACLFRATAPIYLLVALAPMAVTDLWGSGFVKRSRRHGWLVAISTTALLAGWFYVLNFDYLYYYYVVWNTDANAKLSLLESLIHLKMVNKQLGIGFVLWLLGGFLITRIYRTGDTIAAPAPDVPRGQWIRLCWLAVVPLIILIGRRMGLNPFVSMPTAILLQAIVGVWLGKGILNGRMVQTRMLWAMLLIAIIVSIGRGYKKHAFPHEGLMPEHQRIVRLMIDDAQAQGLSYARFASIAMIDFETASLHSVILFDQSQGELRGKDWYVDNVRLSPANVFNLPAVDNWQSIESTDAKRIERLVARAANEIEYLIVPTAESARQISEQTREVVVNRFAPEILAKLKQQNDQQWTPIATGLAGKDGRTYELWRRK